MEIIGRKKEKAVLDHILVSKQAEFVAIYGRRRVGKTFLVRNTCSKKGVYFECSGLKDGTFEEQLANFSRKFSDIFYPGLALQTPKNWREAFELLTTEIKKIPKKKKVIVFMDELPWLATPRSKLLQNLDYFWNSEWSLLPNFKLIVCGSAAAWMLNHLINAKGGLHNRITRSILLEPFKLDDTKRFLESKKIKLSEKQIVDLYMIMGGIPFYLNQLEKSKSLVENINSICFEKDGLLYSEFPRLFKSLFNSIIYAEIVIEISKHRYGISLIQLLKNLSKKPGGRFLSRLDELEACGFIQSFLPFGREKRDKFYRVSDEYTLFYLRWIIEIVEGKIIPVGINYWQKISKSPSWYSWAGLSFESVIFKHADKLINVLGLGKIGCSISFWSYHPKLGEEGAQVDLLIDRDDNAITICELKYSNQNFVIDKNYGQILMKKMSVIETQLRTKKQLFIAMITASGLKKNLWSNELINQSIEISELF